MGFRGAHFVNQVLPFSNYLDKSCNRPGNNIFKKLDVYLGKLWLSCSNQPVSETDRTVAALQPTVLMERESKEADCPSVLNYGSSKVRLFSSDRKEDLEKLEKDSLYTSSKDDNDDDLPN